MRDTELLIEIIDDWFNGEIANTILEDSEEGCLDSIEFIDDLKMRFDSALFFYEQAKEFNKEFKEDEVKNALNRAAHDLQGIVDIINEL